MARLKCTACRGKGYVEGPDVEVVTVEGISYKVNHWPKGGTTVEAPCNCFGGMRAHSSESCPWLAQRQETARKTAQKRS